ncbi:UDP-galactose transporter Gms1 [Mycoemilia scoparia]|uniref:UDP-galactose transporter Gms1 n=1 Tax=Mycoemilia scoparia TaxID=417184 RepID=A0A9W8DWX9_9FUNG|nr:UDP-galactose transporter Gms1 [Mycoemilia scoparia]
MTFEGLTALPKIPMLFGIPLKWVSLATLVIQNSVFIIILTYSKRESPDATYLNSTAVLFSELIKILISLAMIVYDFNKSHPYKDNTEMMENVRMVIKDEILGYDAFMVAIPALLYTIQNTLQYIAADKLGAAIFQVTSQLKILTTALCSVFLLKTTLSGRKWRSLVLLLIGVVLVQIQSTEHATNEGLSEIKSKSSSSVIIGLSGTFFVCLSSGLSSVYFEKIIKETAPSLWVRNLQLSTISLLICVIGIFALDFDAVKENGLLYGYTASTWCAILFQATGGIIVALTLKHADNILKSFATSISIIISSVLSIWVFDFYPGLCFILGTILVIYASIAYNTEHSQPTQPDKNLNGLAEMQTRTNIE